MFNTENTSGGGGSKSSKSGFNAAVCGSEGVRVYVSVWGMCGVRGGVYVWVSQ